MDVEIIIAAVMASITSAMGIVAAVKAKEESKQAVDKGARLASIVMYGVSVGVTILVAATAIVFLTR